MPSSRVSLLLNHSYLPSSSKQQALPTNAWYQNLLLLKDNEQPSSEHRVYTMPYVVDSAGDIPGLRVHTFQKVSSYNTVNLAINEPHAVTLGATLDFTSGTTYNNNAPKGYSVANATPLGVTLEWVCIVSLYIGVSFLLNVVTSRFHLFRTFSL
jgi:hypothetical protein